MFEFEVFKRSFFLGRLVWFEASNHSSGMQVINGLLHACDVPESGIWDMTVDQFIDVHARGFDPGLLSRFEVIRVRNVEVVTVAKIKRFAVAVKKFESLQVSYGVRLVLVSNEILPALLQELLLSKPMIFWIRSVGGPCDLNLRVHRLLELASVFAKVKVNRITEKAAYFLEEGMREGIDEDLMILVALGLKRSKGRVLRFRDLVPNFAPYFEQGEDHESA